MTRAFHKRLREVWAPTSLFKLGAESKRLHAEEAALGMPPAHVELSGTKLEQLRAAAIEAAKLILERQGDAIVDAAQKRAASVLRTARTRAVTRRSSCGQTRGAMATRS